MELSSLSDISRRFSLLRLTVQSDAEFRVYPLDKSGFASVVNVTFLSFRVRDKSSRKRGAQ